MNEVTARLFRVAGTIFITPPNPNATNLRDMLDCVLLAQLYANKQYDPFDTPELWRKIASKTINQLGWIVTGSESTTEVAKAPFSLNSVASATLDKLDGIQLEAALMQLSQACKDSLKPYCLRKRPHMMEARISVAVALAANQLLLNTVSFDGDDVFTDDWLNQKHSASPHQSAHIRVNSSTLTLVADYSSIRNEVITKLGSHRTQEIERID